MTEYGEVWADESCSWAEVNGVYGEIYNFDGELWVMDDAQNYLAQVPPGVAQCQAYMQTAAVSPTDPTTDPVWQGSQPGAQGDIWIDENCEWADVGGYTGYVAEVDGYLYIYSEAGDYMADLPPGMFPQCGY